MIPRVFAFAALSGPLPKLGVVVLAGLVAGALLSRARRMRALAMLGAIVLAPVLLLADVWRSAQLGVVHRHPLLAAAGAVVALALVGLLAYSIDRRPALLGALAVLALPFRIPIATGGSTKNLLLPLYLVVAAGAAAFIVPALRSRGKDEAQRGRGKDEAQRGHREDEARRDHGDRSQAAERGWTERLLALYVVLYSLQSVYSAGFETALTNMVFFYVPFALLFCLLRRLHWTPRLLRTCLLIGAGLAVAFAAVGFAEYATKTIILNPKLVVTNDLHAYFTVNSVFFDPDIFGRFLALVMILLAAVLLNARRPRVQWGAMAVLALLWAGLVLTLSRSSLSALLVGLGVLAALRFRASRALVVAAAVIALGAAAVAVSPRTFGLNQGLNGASSGRAGLVGGGLSLFGDRPGWGFGSGSFVTEYSAQHRAPSQNLAASHTIAITIAAEQGLIGELPYVALVLVAAIALLRGARSDPARAAIAAAFIALVFHTLLYADFLEDPVTWTLLGVGVALAARPRSEPGWSPDPDTSPAPGGKLTVLQA